MNNREIRELKNLITFGNLYELKARFNEYVKTRKEYQNDINIFQQLFTHSCINRQFNIAKWLYHNIYMINLI